ncbi:hypothetical protein Taro_057025 [Colocasia esculenta]|uniref:Uncharacterized protein n=1 Tax=Colocasia esculenta TaxID=4460 RepID=A0A843XZ68_COLES|nr:hypothetical protein [Colocasia esculenta]
MWTFRVAVALGGIRVDANLRILQVIGSPEGRFPTLFSILLAPACCPSVPKASNRYKHLFTKEVSTHPSMVSTHHLSLKGKKLKNCLDCVDTCHRVCRHELQIPGISVPRSTHSQSRSTLDPVPRTTSLQNWDSRSTHSQSSVSTPPPGQVDTLRKVCNLKWMAATCQPRPMGNQPRIVCPYT